MKVYFNKILDISFDDPPIMTTYYYTPESLYYFKNNKLYKDTLKILNSYQTDNLYVDDDIYETTEVYHIPYVHYESMESYYRNRINERMTLVKHVYNDVVCMYMECSDLSDVISFISNN